MDDPQDREDPWRIPPLSGPPSNGNVAKAIHDREAGIPASGRRNGSSGARVGGDICSLPPENHFPVYRD